MRVLVYIGFIFLYMSSQDCSALLNHSYSGYMFEDPVGWVKLHSPATWHEARLRCYYEGAVLASPTDLFLKSWILKMVQEQEYEQLYTGIHATFSKGDFTTVEGIPLIQLNLKREACHGEGDCMAINRDGILEALDCNTKVPYACYKRGSHNILQHTKCGTLVEGYEYSLTTGSCYKFHRMGRTWSRAFMTCLAEGGHLAIINSKAEAQVVKEIFEKNPENTIMATYTHTASIGFQDWGERGSWWTIYGNDLSQAGYDEWDKGSRDSTNTQFCGSINRSGKLNDIWCDGEKNTFPAICEIDANLIP